MLIIGNSPESQPLQRMILGKLALASALGVLVSTVLVVSIAASMMAGAPDSDGMMYFGLLTGLTAYVTSGIIAGRVLRWYLFREGICSRSRWLAYLPCWALLPLLFIAGNTGLADSLGHRLWLALPTLAAVGLLSGGFVITRIISSQGRSGLLLLAALSTATALSASVGMLLACMLFSGIAAAFPGTYPTYPLCAADVPILLPALMATCAVGGALEKYIYAAKRKSAAFPPEAGSLSDYLAGWISPALVLLILPHFGPKMTLAATATLLAVAVLGWHLGRLRCSG